MDGHRLFPLQTLLSSLVWIPGQRFLFPRTPPSLWTVPAAN